MAEITAKFRERALLIHQYATDEDMRRTRYHSMLRDDIGELVSCTGCKTWNEMVEKAHEREMEFESRTKRKTKQVQAAGAQAKNSKTSDSSGKGQHGWGGVPSVGGFIVGLADNQDVRMLLLWPAGPHE